MKKNILLGSALLATAFMLNTPSAMAFRVEPPPYTSEASADAQGDFDSGPTSASAYGPMTHSRASVNDFELHSYSEVYDGSLVADSTLEAGISEEPPVRTRGDARFSQRFTVVGAGTATLRFEWDGQLYSNGTYAAGFGFGAEANGDTLGYLGGVRDGDTISGGTANINLFHSIDVTFDASDIGSMFDVYASLNTYAGDIRRKKLDADFDFASIVTEIDPRAAYADFSNTAVFSFTGQGVIAPAAVPVPAAVWLFGSALLGLIGIQRKKSTA